MVTKKTAAKKAPVKKATPKKAAAKKTTAKRAAAKKAAPVRKRAAAKKTTAPRKRAPRKKSQPAKPDVDAVVEQVAAAAAAAGEPGPDYDPEGKPAGPVEVACRRELGALKLHGTALGASAIQLARLADQTESAAGAATALREMRMTLGAARSLGNIGGDKPTGEGDGNVVPESRLEQMRKRHQGGTA